LAYVQAGLPTSAAAVADQVASTVKDVDVHGELQANGFGAVHQQMQRPVPAPMGAEPAFADMLVGGVGSGALPFHPAHVSIQVVPAATTALMAAAVAAATNSAGAGAVLVLVLVLVLVMVMVLMLVVFDATRVERLSPSPMS
jgi:hypothetical protein